jgi:four helix bundle protein
LEGLVEMINFTKKKMSFKFEKLIIWQKAMDFGEEINNLTLEFPKKEMYNLSSQILRAVDSVALNIAEGSIEQSNAEFNRFLGYSVRSLAEVVTCLYKAKRRNYLNEDLFLKLYNDSFNLMNMMIGFKSKLKPNV